MSSEWAAEVAVADEPFVVLFDHDAGGEPDQRAIVGEDADDVGAAADLAVDPFERVGRAQLRPVVGGEGVEGEQVLLGFFEQRGDFRQWLAQPLERVADEFPCCSPVSALKIGRSSAASIACWSLRACPSASRRKWTLQRCQGQPSTCAIAFFSPACASETTSCTPVRPRLTSERRKLRQKASVSALADVERDHLAVTGLVHAVGEHQALRTTRPPSRTFSTFASSHRYG